MMNKESSTIGYTHIMVFFLLFQEVFLQYSFGEVLSTRRYRSDSNQNYLDMKLGNLMVQKIVRIETELVCGTEDVSHI